MSRWNDTRTAFGKTQQDLAAERGAALSRIAGRLEELIATLRQIRDAAGAAAGAERERLTAAYTQLRQEATRYRWYLEVQRESIGMRRHHVLDEIYRIPDPLD